MPFMHRSSSGFTLFEILVVMAIMAIVAGLLVPRISTTMAAMKLKAGARGCSGILRYARNLAITSHKKQRVWFGWTDHPDKEGITVVSCKIKGVKRWEEDPFLLDEKITLSWQEEPEGDWIVLEKGGKHEILFDYRGYTTGGRLRLAFMKDKEGDIFMAYAISIDPITGRVKIERINE